MTSFQEKTNAWFLLLGAAAVGALMTAQMRPAEADAVVVTVPTGARQTLQAIGTSQPPRTTPPTYYGRVDEARRNQMVDLVYRDLGMKVFRLWVHLSPTITVEDMKKEFYLSYVDSGLLADVAKRGTTTLLLAPAMGPKLEHPIAPFMERLATFIKDIRDERGIQIHVTGIANEPSFETQKIVDGVRHLRQELDARGLKEVGIIAAENANNDSWAYRYIDAMKAEPFVWNALQGIASHSYNMAATADMAERVQGTGKEFWMTEAGDNGPEEPGDTKRAASMAGRFLNDMNHRVTHWIWFIGIGHQDPDNDAATKLVQPAADGGLKIHTKYWYFKQLRAAFADRAVFRAPTSSLNGDMVWTYGDKPSVIVSAAQNDDGSWAIGAVNTTGLESTKIATFPAAQTMEVTIKVDELVNSGTVPFAMYRSQPNGPAKQEVNLQVVNGQATFTLAPQELITLRSVGKE